MQKHVVTLKDLSPEQLRAAVEDAERFRGERRSDLLAGHTVVLVFFNPSLRTRVSMELAGKHLGAEVVTVNVGTDVWRLEHRDGAVMNEDRAEHIKDAVRVLSRYGDVVGVRAFPGRRSWEEDREDPIVRGFARWADVPVLNLESSLYHPCQGLADVITIQRALGPDPGKIVLAWTDHPKALPVAVPDSFATAVTRMGWDLTIAHPRGYDLPTEVVASHDHPRPRRRARGREDRVRQELGPHRSLRTDRARAGRACRAEPERLDDRRRRDGEDGRGGLHALSARASQRGRLRRRDRRTALARLRPGRESNARPEGPAPLHAPVGPERRRSTKTNVERKKVPSCWTSPS
ncbi:MAG: Rossmann-fold NAD(P)-binding domain-containing protein [Planctomycetota bacterium]|jgi:ornithine carbamoyltransferase